MSPAAAIAMLDRQLAAHGQTVVLRRVAANAPAIERQVRAFVRGYKPSELSGGIQQGDTLLVLSPSDLPAEFADTDATRLKRLDKVVLDGRPRTVEFVVPVRISEALVRMDVTVRG